MENWLTKSEVEYRDDEAKMGRIINDLVGFEERRLEKMKSLRERYAQLFALCTRANTILTSTKGCEIKQEGDSFFSVKKYARTYGSGGDGGSSTSTLKDVFEVVFDADDAGLSVHLKVNIDRSEFKNEAEKKRNFNDKRHHFTIEDFDALDENCFVHMIKTLAIQENSSWDLFLKCLSKEYRSSVK